MNSSINCLCQKRIQKDGCTDQYISLVVSNNGNSYCCQYSHGNNVIKDYCLSMTLKKNNVHWNYILLKVV